MRYVSVISGHPIFIGFCRLTGYQRDPWDRGITSFPNSLRLTTISITKVCLVLRFIVVLF